MPVPFLQEAWAAMTGSVTRTSRSTALKSLLWLIAVVLGAIVGCLKYGAPQWLLIILAGTFAVVVLATLAAYFYFMIKDPAALRSEGFALHKLALEHGIRGDNLTGITPVEITPGRLQGAEGPSLISDGTQTST